MRGPLGAVGLQFRFHTPGAPGLFVSVFAATILLGAILQLYLLPMVFPSLHWGHGLLVGGDWCGFHQEAERVAHAVESHGWHAWEPWPGGHWPAGAAAALYAFVGIHEPWVMLPVHGLLHAMGVMLFFVLFRHATGRPSVALLATAPYLFFPSCIMIWGQLHKDIWMIPAVLLIMLSWVSLSEPQRATVPAVLRACLLTLIALPLLIFVRPYSVKVLFAGSFGAFLYLLGGAAWRKLRHRVDFSRMWLTGALGVLALFILAMYMPSDRPNMDVSALSKRQSPADRPLLQMMNAPARAIDSLRMGFFTTYSGAGSFVDRETRFDNLTDVVLYLPRALQIGLLSPWPAMWFEPAASPGGRWMRWVSAAEMTVAYLLLPGLLIALRRGSPAVRTLGLFCVVIVIIQSLAVPNVGTLYRMRYVFFQVLLGLGIVGYGCLGRTLGRRQAARYRQG